MKEYRNISRILRQPLKDKKIPWQESKKYQSPEQPEGTF